MASQKSNKKFKKEQFDEEEPKYKGKGKKGNKGPKDARKINKSQRYDRVSTDTATNSVDWYVSNPQMLNDAASIQYFNSLGNTTFMQQASKFLTNYVGPTGITFSNTSNLDRSVPGIFALHFVPTIGRAQDNADPINIAARNIYGFVRKANSGSKNYDAPNLMMYLMACDSVFTYYQWMLRIYGLLRKYSTYNKYYNEAMLKAMNVNASSFAGNISDFRAYINKFAMKANSLCVPNTFTIYQRHMYLVSALFKDTEAMKAQVYLFNPDYLYYYDEPNGKLKAQEIGKAATALTLADVMNTGDLLLNSILTSEDMAIMKGDILKAFGDSGIYQLSMIGEDYETQAVHDYEILTEIQAANFLGPINLPNKSSLDIVEDTTPGSSTEGALKQSVTSMSTYTASGTQDNCPTGNLATIVNMYVDNPTPADTMVATRLAHYSVPYVQGDATSATLYNTAIYYGSEVCTTYSIWYLDSNCVGQPFTLNGLTEFVNGTISIGHLACAMSPFEWHPVILGVTLGVTLAATPTASISYNSNVDFDWDNYTVLASDVMQRLHECALLGEFRIPQMGIMM